MDNKTKEVWDKAIQQLQRIANSLSGEPRQHGDQVTGDQDGASSSGDDSVSSSLAVQDTRSRSKRSEQSKIKWYRTLNGWKTRLEIPAFVFAIGYAIVTFFQWQDANTNFRAGQRAWVGIDRFAFAPLEPEKAIVWETILKNFGNSPAKSVAIRDNVELVVAPRVDPTMAWMLTASLPKASGKAVTMFNGQTFTDHGGINYILSDKQIHDIAEGGSLLLYIGEIKYTDIFGKEHTTMLCQVMDVFGTHGCGFGETAD